MSVKINMTPHYTIANVQMTGVPFPCIEVVQCGLEKIKITKDGKDLIITHGQAVMLAQILQTETKKD